MAEGGQETSQEQTHSYSEDGLSDDVKALAAKGRGEEAPAPINNEKPQRPDNIPEKFWDAEKGAVNQEALLNSYLELEKSRAKPAEEDPKKGLEIGKDDKKGDGDEGDPNGDGGADDEAPKFSPEKVGEAVASVRDRYAQSGELTADDRKSLNEVGFDDATIDTYMQGIKAIEEQMRNTAFSLAGDEETYRSAVKWAKDNWTAEEIEAYDRDLSNPKLLGRAVKGLVNDYKAANPGEGTLRSGHRGTGADGDTYSSQDEFQADLRKADEAGDPTARRKAVDKLRRSREAGTITSPNRNPFDQL